MAHKFLILTMVILFASFLGCANKEHTYWAINDSDSYWHRFGFSIKPPTESNWTKIPANDNFPNAIMFLKGEGLGSRWASNPTKWVYLNYNLALATSSLLDEPLTNRTDKSKVAAALRNHLDHYRMFTTVQIKEASYDGSMGFDCLKYLGKTTKNRFMIEQTDMREGEVKGYYCLHPQNDSFGVVMESHNFASVNTNVTNKNDQVDHFFTSLLFTKVPNMISRMFQTKSYQVGKSPYQLILYQGKIWAAIKDENRVVQIDPSNGVIIASIDVGSQPVSVSSGEHAIWVANSGDETVTRIDPINTKVVTTIPISGKPVSVSVGRGGVWVANSTGDSIIRINPVTNTVIATISVGKEPVSVNASKDGIWTANAGDGTVSLIDPAHDWPINTIKIGGRPVRVSLNKSGAWIADEASNSVVRIERKTRNIIARIDVGMKPKWIYSIDDGDVFVALSDKAKIVRIDPTLNRVFGPAIELESMPYGMVYFNGSIWAANSGSTTLSQINLSPFGQVVGIQSPP